MIRIPNIAILAAALLMPIADAPPWLPAATACGQWAETHICIGRAGCPSWEWETRCAIERVTPKAKLPVVKGKVEQCISGIEFWRNQHHMARTQGNPIADAMACIQSDAR